MSIHVHFLSPTWFMVRKRERARETKMKCGEQKWWRKRDKNEKGMSHKWMFEAFEMQWGFLMSPLMAYSAQTVTEQCSLASKKIWEINTSVMPEIFVVAEQQSILNGCQSNKALTKNVHLFQKLRYTGACFGRGFCLHHLFFVIRRGLISKFEWECQWR